jgi:putative ATP-dependent endonuclease of the OLD family
MKIYSVTIENFRGIRSAKLTLPDHAVLIGDNNTGKSSVFEAIDLALGPDRLSRRPPVDEHDFYQGKYLPVENPEAPEGAEPGPAPKIMVEVTITNLSPEQEARFGANVEWLNTITGIFYEDAKPAGVDAAEIKAALRVMFIGEYDPDEDDLRSRSRSR